MSDIYNILLKQHIGAPDIPVVKIGDMVSKGQLIAEPDGLGANIHASVDGEIVKIDDCMISIKPSGKSKGKDGYISLDTDGSINEIIKNAGIVGMGGAGFPTGIKFSGSIEDGIVIANGAECEPVLAHNVVQMEKEPEKIYKGLLFAMESINAQRGVIAIKSKHNEAIQAMKSVIKDERVTVHELPDMYPMGEERAIVREVLGVVLGPDKLPSEVNAVVSNVETLARICEAVESGKPAISKNITVAGKLKKGTGAQVFMDVPIGTRVGDLIDAAGGIDGDYGEIIMGGPFTGHSVGVDDVITKTSGGIIVTMPFPQSRKKLGLLVCACSAGEARMREIAEKMGAEIAGSECCKQAVEVKGNLKCENPGECPGQAERILRLKKNGAEALLISNCSDCSNTVMGVAPKMKLPVYHITDHVMRTMGYPLVRRLKLK